MVAWRSKSDPPSARRKYFRSFALIPHPEQHDDRWLCEWDQRLQHLKFICADRTGSDSFRKCIQAEVLRTLGLGRKDILVSNMAQLNSEFFDVLPGEREERHVAVTFYIVNLYSHQSRELVADRDRFSWLSGKELREGESRDGRAVDPVLAYLLRRTDVIRAW